MLLELLRRTAREAPDRPVMISPRGTLTYGACVARSEAVARGLRARGIERFGIAVRDPGDVLVLLAGSSAAGSEGCTYPRCAGPETTGRLARRFEHPVVVTDAALELDGSEALPLDRVPAGEGELTAPAQAPVLVLTTGTTGDQKGARHDWERLIGAMRHPDPRPGSRWLLAYNLNQFGGVQVLLHALVNRATLVAAASSQPGDVLDVMRSAGVTHVSATPTFWRLLSAALDEDVARGLALEQITLGGEPVPGPLIERLVELFPDARTAQIYGSTEVGTAVSVRDGRAGLPRSVLDRPQDAPIRLRVVDGEIQIRSTVGMRGYHHGDAPREEWVATGDLVEERGDRLHFVGRVSDIINVGGAKVHPLPVEDVAGAVPGVRLVAAYGHPNPVVGQIVALDVVRDPETDAETLERAIRSACETLPPPARPRRIRFVDRLGVRGSKVVRGGVPEGEA